MGTSFGGKPEQLHIRPPFAYRAPGHFFGQMPGIFCHRQPAYRHPLRLCAGAGHLDHAA